MLNIDNKFEIGQEVYLLEKKHCPVCNGKGSFYHNGYYIECPKCKMKNSGQYIVAEGTYKITGIRTNTHDGVNFSIRYNVGGKKLPENRIFATKEEAEARCKELTLEKIRREERY